MMILNPYVIFNSFRDHFEAVFDTTKTSTGSSDANSIRLPLTNMDGLNVDWGDGTTNSLNTHTYATSGVKNVKITGVIRGWSYNNTGDILKITEIKEWGQFRITATNVFYGCANLKLNNVNGVPIFETSSATSLFRACSMLDKVKGINSWDMSGISNTIGIFRQATLFNDNITSWDMSNVTNMNTMFQSATAFNQNIGSWDVSNVTSMSLMFSGATAFNQNIGSWDVSNVTSMNSFLTGKSPSTFSTVNLDAIYNGWSSRTLKTGVAISFGSAKHTAASQAGRNILTNTYGWTITDGGI